jgi:hypothetical protein
VVILEPKLKQEEAEMSLLTRAKEVTGGLANTSKRQAQRGKLELEIRRLEGKLGSEKSAIGDALFPLLESGTLAAPGVSDHVSAIRALMDEIDAKRSEIDDLKAANDDEALDDKVSDLADEAGEAISDLKSSVDGTESQAD